MIRQEYALSYQLPPVFTGQEYYTLFRAVGQEFSFRLTVRAERRRATAKRKFIHRLRLDGTLNSLWRTISLTRQGERSTLMLFLPKPVRSKDAEILDVDNAVPIHVLRQQDTLLTPAIGQYRHIPGIDEVVIIQVDYVADS